MSRRLVDPKTLTHMQRVDPVTGEPIGPKQPLKPLCEWYALCVNLAVGVIEHPVLGRVPCCQRCADKHDMADRLLPFV